MSESDTTLPASSAAVAVSNAAQSADDNAEEATRPSKRAKTNQDDDVRVISDGLLALPDSVLTEILEYGSIIDGRRLLITCKTLHSVKSEVEGRRFVLTIFNPKERDVLLLDDSAFLQNLTSLRSLDLGQWARDQLLEAMDELLDPMEHDNLVPNLQHNLVPNLEHISMVSSAGISDDGLRILSQGASRRRNLRTIDITYCENTTYEGTFQLRENLENLQLIRRQPPWMDGRLEYVEGPKITRWADGAFHQLYENRDDQDREVYGWAIDTFPWTPSNPNHIRSKYQVSSNARFLADALAEAEDDKERLFVKKKVYFYRPGESFLHEPSDNSFSSGETPQQTILLLEGKDPVAPDTIPTKAQKDVVPVGECRWFDENGNAVSEHSDQRFLQITRLPAFPLDTLMPPDDIVRRNIEFFDSMDAFRREHNLNYDEEARMTHPRMERAVSV